ncbi:Chlorophyllide a oxygenase, chloroplastic [Coccomyxa sp. Obi]|nr:Chlorophyllide a oxygenase, chloroplastic [Coccomyxa sp. Obi]
MTGFLTVRCSSAPSPEGPPRKDPELRFRRFGNKDSGGCYIYRERNSWWKEVPRIRVRDKQERINNLWGELAALNERLAGGDAITARKRIDYLRVRKVHWARIISAATQYDTAITLALIEDANKKVAEALKSETRERAPVPVLKKQLLSLQADLSSAHERLHSTQERLAENLARIKDLQANIVMSPTDQQRDDKAHPSQPDPENIM